MKGKFITFEGSEGCGKSTQSKLLYKFLKSKGYPVVYLREPGGVRISERIRKILLDPRNHIAPTTEMLLYMAARAQVVNDIIKPELLKGNTVICDRFLDSTVAYQGYGLGMDVEFIKRVGDFVTGGIKPDLTIFLDLAVKKGLVHREGKKDRIEKRSFRYHMRVRNGYLKLASRERGRIKIVKVDKDKNFTQEAIRKIALQCHFKISKDKLKR
ncbi:MAG: dTMP kinase [Candidatus Omnitrophica bacterium]|nr:dTMP kinase [Candidatus Omnitrophota bacterium]